AAKAEGTEDRMQSLWLGVGDRHERIKNGLMAEVTPVLAADQESMQLEISAAWTAVYGQSNSEPIASTLKLDKGVNVPKGQTVGYHLGRTEGENVYDYAVPVLSDIPGLTGLFTGTAYFHGQRDVFLLVTPQTMPQAIATPVGKK